MVLPGRTNQVILIFPNQMLWLESESEIATRSEAIARKRDFLKKNPAINGEDSCPGAVARIDKPLRNSRLTKFRRTSVGGGL